MDKSLCMKLVISDLGQREDIFYNGTYTAVNYHKR